MIKIKKHEVKNTVEELTVEQFEEISAIQNDESLNYIDKQIKVFTTLGVPQDVIDDMEIDEFKKTVKKFNNVKPKEYPFLAEVEIEGFVYKAYDKKFKLPIKDLKHIENKIKSSPKKYIAFMLAVIFKREDLTKTEHYDQAHLKQKEKLFSKLPAAICIPYINYIGKEFSDAVTK